MKSTLNQGWWLTLVILTLGKEAGRPRVSGHHHLPLSPAYWVWDHSLIPKYVRSYVPHSQWKTKTKENWGLEDGSVSIVPATQAHKHTFSSPSSSVCLKTEHDHGYCNLHAQGNVQRQAEPRACCQPVWSIGKLQAHWDTLFKKYNKKWLRGHWYQPLVSACTRTHMHACTRTQHTPEKGRKNQQKYHGKI